MGFRASRRRVDALALAIATGGPQVVRERLAAEPELARHWRPIHEACVHGRAEIVRLLLDAGADPNAVAPISGAALGARPLHRAVAAAPEAPRGPEHVRIVALLLERGADPNARGGALDLRPLEFALLSGARRFVSVLLEGGAIVDAYTSSALGDEPAILEAVDEGFVVDTPDRNSMTALHYACAARVDPHDPDALSLRRRLREVAERWIELGAAIEDAPQDRASRIPSRTALEWAIDHGSNGFLIRSLLERGADPNRGDVLLAALLQSAVDIAELLVQAGADVDRRMRSGEPALVALARLGRSAMVEWMLAHGADPNQRAVTGDTVLLAAARRGLPARTVRKLLQAGADRSVRDGRGRSPLDLAAERDLRDLVALLAE